MTDSKQAPSLFLPLTIRGLTLRNRVVVSPMQQYSATDGVPGDWHQAHLTRLAMGGAALVFVEATAVEKRGRNTHGDTGIWSDEHVEPLSRLAKTIKSHGPAAGIQLGHTGRKAGLQRPWEGHGRLGPADAAARNEGPWEGIGPTDEPVGPDWPSPRAMTLDDIESVVHAWGEAARRALQAGFDVIEVHGGHGYLMHQFLSPLANKRTDDYGGGIEGRMRFPLRVAEALRKHWPADKPLFWRVSSVDGAEGGSTIEDTIAFARALHERGVDVIDCSSGGISGFATAGSSIPRGLGFQVPWASQIRAGSGVKTMAVGLIIHPEQAEEIVATGKADLVAIGREALHNPNWPLHAAEALGWDEDMDAWPPQYGWWLSRRAKVLAKMEQK